MKGRHVIYINGRQYDAISGLPVAHDASQSATQQAPAKAPAATRPAAKPHHHAPHRSVTLRRDLVKKPVAPAHAQPSHKQHAHVAKSPAISRFAPHPTREHATHHSTQAVSPVVHAAQTRASAITHQLTLDRHHSRTLKEHLIAERIQHASPNTTRPGETALHRKPLSTSVVLAACFGIMLLGAYVSYSNMPNLSVRVAAMQAGVNASFPGYTPNGYHFAGPVAFDDGKVKLNFSANGGNVHYNILQQKSSWDSQSVLDKLVSSQTKDYDINESQGLRVYTYGNNEAAWVSRGVLYTLTGNAPLKTDQLLRIANSL